MKMGCNKCKKKCYCPIWLLPPFPSGGGTGILAVLPNRELQVATGYSPGTPLTNYQFTSVQDAIDYAVTNLTPSVANPVVIKIYPGTYTETITLASNIHLVCSGDPYSSILQNVVFTSQTAGSVSGFANVRFGTFQLTMSSDSVVTFLNCVFSSTPTFSSSSIDSQIGVNGAVFTNGVNFVNMQNPVARTATVEISNAIFENGNVNIGTSGIAFVNIRNSRFREPVQVFVGNGNDPSTFRANNCTFENDGFGSPAVTVASNSFTNLMDSVISPSAVSGAGTADMNIMTTTGTINTTDTVLSFDPDFNTVMNVSDTNYSVAVVRLGSSATGSGIAVSSKSLTGITLIAETQDSYEITIFRNWSNI